MRHDLSQFEAPSQDGRYLRSSGGLWVPISKSEVQADLEIPKANVYNLYQEATPVTTTTFGAWQTLKTIVIPGQSVIPGDALFLQFLSSHINTASSRIARLLLNNTQVGADLPTQNNANSHLRYTWEISARATSAIGGMINHPGSPLTSQAIDWNLNTTFVLQCFVNTGSPQPLTRIESTIVRNSRGITS